MQFQTVRLEVCSESAKVAGHAQEGRSHNSNGTGLERLQIWDGIGPHSDVQDALAIEARMREDADQELFTRMKEMIGEERRSREQDYRLLEISMHSSEQLIFIDSGKREERDREL